MSEDTLRERLEGNYVLAIEVTNGLGKKEFGFKVDEALWGKSYLKKFNPSNIETGLIFVKNEKAITDRRFNLDILGQIHNFNQTRTILALENALSNERIKDRAIKIVLAFQEEMRKGAQLNELFYPSEQQMIQFLQKFKELSISPTMKDYHNAISEVKGVTLEKYVGLFLKEKIPKAEIISGHEYTRQNRTVDIDHIVIGRKDEIRTAIMNSKDIRTYNTTEREPKIKFYKPMMLAFR